MKNIYKCPKKLWDKMSYEQEACYNYLRGIDKEFILPAKLNLSDKEWDILSHNFSYIASTIPKDHFKD